MLQSLLLLFALASPLAPYKQADAAIACYDVARETTLLSEQKALRLCCGMRSVAPVECYNEITDAAVLSERKAIRLCSCATSIEPARCFMRGQEDTTLSEIQLIESCRERRGIIVR